MSGIQKHLGNYESAVLCKEVKSLNVTFREKETTLDDDDDDDDDDAGLYSIQYFFFCVTDKGMVRSDMSKPALIFFFHCKSTHNKIHCQNSSC
jgi:hypothetical protein